MLKKIMDFWIIDENDYQTSDFSDLYYNKKK